MSASRSTLKRNRLRHRLGFSESRLAVRCHVPWYRYALVLLGAVLLGAGLVLVYQVVGKTVPQAQAVQELRDQATALQAEVDRLSALVGTAPNALLMAESAQQKLSQQLASAQAELGKAREDLGLCEKTVKRDNGVRRAPIVIPGAGTIPASNSTNSAPN
jgi:uncharacterized membrane protein YcjF (UPF0283 family)